MLRADVGLSVEGAVDVAKQVAPLLGLTPLPLLFLALLGLIVVMYIASAELAKRVFYRILHE